VPFVALHPPAPRGSWAQIEPSLHLASIIGDRAGAATVDSEQIDDNPAGHRSAWRFANPDSGSGS
jgi:hypothetical protein